MVDPVDYLVDEILAAWDAILEISLQILRVCYQSVKFDCSLEGILEFCFGYVMTLCSVIGKLL